VMGFRCDENGNGGTDRLIISSPAVFEESRYISTGIHEVYS
jgi:hypothetical protein